MKLGIDDVDRKYEILERLGEGGMGEVYKARHVLLDEVRVIKTIRTGRQADPEMQARFLREARLATRLRHPHVAATYDFSMAEDGTACIVMEYVEGRSLSDHLPRHGDGLAPAEVVEVGRQLLDALGYLHRQGVVHRDVSPDNVLLSRDDEGRLRAKLIDLGIAKPLEGTEELTRTSMFVGKIRYASPEQLAGGGEGSLDGRSDLYSAAVVLCELLTGSLPVTGTDQASLVAGHLFQPPRSFDETDPQGRVPAALRRVLLKALAKKPEDRHADAATFAAALQGALEEATAGAAAVTASGAGAGAGSGAGAESGAGAGAGAGTGAGAGADPGVGSGVDSGATTGPAAGTASGAGAGAVPEADPALPAGAVSGEAVPGEAVPGEAAPRPGAPGRRRRLRLASALAAGVLVLVVAAVLAWWASPGRDGAGGIGPEVLAGLELGSYRALVIGNDDYRALPDLETAVRDAREVARVLEELYGFDVRLLTDVDRYDLVSALSDFAAAAGPADHLLVYYAGHGEIDRHNESGYWQPVDASPFETTQWVSTLHEVSALLDRSPARHVLVVADSCYAGTDPGPVAGPVVADPGPDADLRQRLEEGLGRRSRLALSSGTLEPVADAGAGGHSLFAAALLAVLRDDPTLLGAPDLHARVRDRVELQAARLGLHQLPQLAPIPRSGHQGGDFFLVPTALRPDRP